MTAPLVKIAFALPPGEWHGYTVESVWAEPAAPGTWRISNTPFYARDVSFEDIVRTTERDGRMWFAGVVARGGHSTYRIIVTGKDNALGKHDAAPFGRAWDLLQRLGCTYEAGPGGLLAVDVPPASDCREAYRRMQEGEDAGIWSFEEGHFGHA